MNGSRSHGTSLQPFSRFSLDRDKWRDFLAARCLCVFLITATLWAQTHLGSSSIWIWITVFLSAIISGTVGFAFSAIAGAVLFQIDGNYIHAVQTMLIASISMQIYSVYYLRHRISLRLLAPFLLGGVSTLGIGVYVAVHTDPKLLLLFIGAFLVLYGLSTITRPKPLLQGRSGVSQFIAGALGGITGPVAAFPAAFVTISCSLTGWDKCQQRGVVQPYILMMQLLSLGGFLVTSGTPEAIDWSLLQYCVPALAGSYLGLMLFQRLNDRQFLLLVRVLLAVSGFAMILKGL